MILKIVIYIFFSSPRLTRYIVMKMLIGQNIYLSEIQNQ